MSVLAAPPLALKREDRKALVRSLAKRREQRANGLLAGPPSLVPAPLTARPNKGPLVRTASYELAQLSPRSRSATPPKKLRAPTLRPAGLAVRVTTMKPKNPGRFSGVSPQGAKGGHGAVPPLRGIAGGAPPFVTPPVPPPYVQTQAARLLHEDKAEADSPKARAAALPPHA